MLPQVDRSKDALIIIDLQNDFCPGGTLAIAGGDEIIEPIDRFAAQFDEIILTQDWHPLDHASFAANHAGVAPFDMVDMPYGAQVAWPNHCVQGSTGAEFHPDLRYAADHAKLILRKGYRRQIDSYSAFFENDRTTATGLAGYLRDKGMNRLFLVGLAYDFCVAYSALDGVALGFDVVIMKDMTRAIDMLLSEGAHSGTVSRMEEKLTAAGVTIVP